MWTAEECDNEDSCLDGQKHFYPDPADIVEVREDTYGRAVGSSRNIKLPAGEYTVGTHIDLQGHQVSLEHKGKLVWASCEDVHPRGPEDFASSSMLGGRL